MYIDQFKHFCPLTGSVSETPYARLPYIAERARSLLAGRSKAELVDAAEFIDELLEMYFETERERFLEQLDSRFPEQGRLLSEDDRSSFDGVRALLENWPSRLIGNPPDFRDPEQTPAIFALKECAERYALEPGEKNRLGKWSEYFAVFALVQVAEANAWLARGADYNPLFVQQPEPPQESPFPWQKLLYEMELQLKEELRTAPELQCVRDMFGKDWNALAYTRGQAGSCALEAMEAVAYAELHSYEELLPRLMAQQERATRRETASKAAQEKHKPAHELRQSVIQWLREHHTDYKSASAAADAVFDAIVEHKRGAGKRAHLPLVTWRKTYDWCREFYRQP